MKKIIFIIFTVIIILFTIKIQRESLQVQIDSKENITYSINERPSDLNMTKSQNLREKDLLISLFQGLVKEDKNGEIIPALAESYKISEDGLEYSFKLRENVYYSTGEKIQTEDYIEFYKEFLGDKENLYAQYLDCIFGAKDFREGKGDFSKVAIMKRESNNLVFRLNYVTPYFIEMLAHPVFVLRDYEKLKVKYEDCYKNIRYTGPFIINNIENKDVYLSKNAKYYNEKSITDESIRFIFNENSEEALAQFQTTENEEYKNSIDILSDVPANEYARLSEEGSIQSFKGSTVYYLSFNLDNKMNKDINFRKSINELLSKEYYSQQISSDIIKPAWSYIYEDYQQEKSFPTFGNSKMALEYYENCKVKDEEIILIYEDSPLNKRIAETISKDIEEDLNVNMSIKGVSDESWKEAIKSGEYHLILQKVTPIFNDSIEYYNTFKSNDINNLIKYNNPRYDELIKSMWNEVNKEKRYEIYRQCEEILKSDLPSIPVYYLDTGLCVDKEIIGIHTTNSGNVILDNIKKLPNKR